MSERLRRLVREIPGFPRPEVLFRDITPLLADASALTEAIDGLAADAAPLAPDYVLAAEARGFVLGAALAVRLGAGLLLARKPGRLPRATVSAAYQLEYGSDSLEVHDDPLQPGQRVLVHDDLLATGGTACALCELTERLGGEVAGASFLVELESLGGRARLAPRPVRSLVAYA
ncbi:MAG: adenine phosphoribosyltransferase [Solirubrobacteraceae bacterium]